MSASPVTSINKLAPDSLAYIFALLPPDERVRLERVCRKWYNVVRELGWIECRTLALDEQELAQRGDRALARYRALINRCGRYLRELFFFGLPWEYDMGQWTGRQYVCHLRNDDARVRAWSTFCLNTEQWAKMRNLRHLRFENVFVSSEMLRAMADNLTCLQSIQFKNIDWRSVAGLHDLLRVHNTSLTSLSLPTSDSRGDSLHLPALPCSLRALHIIPNKPFSCYGDGVWDRFHIDKLLELAASCCPQLAMLILPRFFAVSEASLAMLGRFEKVLSALQSVLQLAHLRSVSICDNPSYDYIRTGILLAINGLNAKRKIEYLHLSSWLSLSVEFVTNLLQANHNLHMLTCAIPRNETPAQLANLNTLLRNMDGPLKLELLGCYCPPQLEMGQNSRVRLRPHLHPAESISQPMLHQLCARAMPAVPDLSNFYD